MERNPAPAGTGAGQSRLGVGWAIRETRRSVINRAGLGLVHEAAPLGDLREAGFPDDSLGTAVRRATVALSKRSREDALGRSQEAEKDNDVGFVLDKLRNVYEHRRLPPLAATLALEGAR